MKTVYLAGPMDQWVDRGRDDGAKNFKRDPSIPAQWRAEIMRRARRVRYVFPEMNEFEGHSHVIYGQGIPNSDIELIKKCDMMLCFLDAPDRIGTFVEIGAAYALGKEIKGVTIVSEKSYVPWFVSELIPNLDWIPIEPDGDGIDTAIDFDQATQIAIEYMVKLCGGDSIDYYEYIKSSEWKLKADEAKQRAGYRCQVCNRGQEETILDAHHRTYERLGNELQEDITVLCRDCHELYEMNRKARKNGNEQIKAN